MIGITGKLRFSDGSPIHPLSGGFKYVINWVEPGKEFKGPLCDAITKRWPHAPQKHALWALAKYGNTQPGEMSVVQVQSDMAICSVVQDSSPPSEELVQSTLSKLFPQVKEDQGSLHFLKGASWSGMEKYLTDSYLKKGIHVCVYSNGQDEEGTQP